MRQRLIIGLLAIIWIIIAGWQFLEHQRVMELSRKGLARRAHDLSAALSVVIRSQGRVTVLPKARLEAALAELVSSTELESVELLNESGEVSAAAGQPMTVDRMALLRTHEYWTRNAASFANLVALGPGAEGTGGMAAILPLDIPWNDERPDRRGPPASPADADDFLEAPPFEMLLNEAQRTAIREMLGNPALSDADIDNILSLFQGDGIDAQRAETLRRVLLGRPLDQARLEELLLLLIVPRHEPGPPLPGGEGRMRNDGFRRHGPPPERPPWMSKDEYERLVQERGVYWFLVTIPTDAHRAEMMRDARLRAIVLGVALFACITLALAWRSSERSSALAIQLVRTRERASRLQELNVTAAGLVHETKNPLNLIRGFAQMISREDGLSDRVRGTAMKITEETDRVTGRLNQFLDYARPAHPQPQALPLNALVDSVFAILACDQEEKSVSFSAEGPAISVMADEDMLRQVLFNLVLNAVQAVSNGGHVTVSWMKNHHEALSLEVRDDGPGVPESEREEIFRPYFTMSKDGTGLGLAVVRQIAMAHHWDVTCLSAQAGAVFRVSNIALAQAETAGSGRGTKQR